MAKRARLRPIGLGALFVSSAIAVHGYTPDRFLHDLPGNLGDPALITWILTWSAHALLHHPFALFNAPMYWPHDLTLAYSDLLLPWVPVYGVGLAVTGRWAASFNLTLLGSVVLAQAGAFALAHRWTARTDAALLASFSFAFSAFALAHWCHPQLQTHGFLALACLALFHALERRTWASGVWLGLATAAVGLCAWYYGAAWSIAATTIVMGHAVNRRRPPDGKLARTLGTAAVVTSVLVVPFALPYVELGHRPGFQRAALPSWGLKPRDLVTPASGTMLYHDLERADCEHVFFPGFLTYALAAAGGIMIFLRGRRGPLRGTSADAELAGSRRAELGLLVAAALVCGVFAAGVEVGGVPAPFRLLHEHVPGFRTLRVPARLAIVSLLAVSCLAAAGFASLTASLPRRRSNALAALAWLVLFVELNGNDAWARLDARDDTLAVYRELARRPPGPVLELPAFRVDQNPTAWTCVEATRAVYATIDLNPRWNGYSGYLPPEYVGQAIVFNEWPTHEATSLARTLGLRYVVLHTGEHAGFPALSEEDAASRAHRAATGRVVGHFGDAWLVDLR